MWKTYKYPATCELMKEYTIENGKVDIEKLRSKPLSKKGYIKAHKELVILCHDVFIQYNGGILLVSRKNYPAKEFLWAIGGKIKRGVRLEESLRNKVREECGLKLKDIKELGCARTFFNTDPFGHGKGTDTLNLVYFARGKGKLKLDSFHETPMIVTRENYAEIKNSLHPYIKNFMDLALPLVNEENN